MPHEARRGSRIVQKSLLGTAAVALGLAGCGGRDTASPVAAPGRDEAPLTRTLEAGAAALQARPPIEAINTYLDGFHFYGGRIEAQMEAHHYCTVLNEELIQCVIYDGNMKDAKLMGVEYILSERLFKSLPDAEKPLWHSHAHEVKSGTLVAPGIPQAAEHALMKKLVGTYGKTFHTWHTDQQHALPTGVPQLMMGFTADGQLAPALVAQRDRRMGIDTAERKAQRQDIEAPAPAEGADAWQQGRVVQIADPTGADHAHPASPPSEGQPGPSPSPAR